ncbi:sulfite exporter TauE/SafE family protein [Bdellovibrio bacteriovorus]|uniref:sulfite exporter TauE/SafE family protein n=1 Tax=Bdellovibrio bacteriovorus TaxID=959 RepID=UPI0035A58025
MMSAALLALGIVSSSFFGSWHCAGMCGPVATLMSARNSLLSYHLGRLVSYVTLGVLAGALGQIFLNSQFVTLRWISAILLALVLVGSGARLILPPSWQQRLSGNKISHSILGVIKRLQAFHVGKSGFVVGLLTALLPCGWLYTYVTAAIATQSPWAGGLTLGLFWLGGLPALSAVPMMVRQGIQHAGLRQQRIAGVVLIVAGLYSLGSFMLMH